MSAPRAKSEVSRRRAEPKELLLFGACLLDASRATGRRSKPPARGAGRSEAVWVRDGTIQAVGPASVLRRKLGRSAAIVDLKGGTLTPGFTDAHIHLLTWRRALDEPWMEEQSPAAVERAVRKRLESAGEEEWVLVRGWVPREWGADRRHRPMLDRIAPDRPLVLYAADGHSVWANGVALARAGIGAGAPDPKGGVIERGSSGELTGVLIESASRAVDSAVVRREAPARTLRRALARARGLGVTSAHDYDRSELWRAAQDLENDEGLGFRLLVSIPLARLDSAIDLGLQSGFGTDRLRIGPVKMFADGTLGSATALLEAPYEGASHTGIEVTSREELAAACHRAAAAGLAVAIHAIGDRAVRNALDAIETPLVSGIRYPLPPRIEHVQLARTEDVPRFRSLGVIASIQPIHQVTDRAVARRYWGPRTERSYAWKTLLRGGASLVFGSDAPFDRPGPLLAIGAAMTRREPGEGLSQSFHPAERLSLREALRSHLEEPHRAAGWNVPMGRLASGYAADLVHFDQDLLEIPTESWHQVGVSGVWVGGRPEPIEK